MSVFTGVTNKEKLGGVFGLSCYLLLSDRIKNYTPEDWPNKSTPFFLAHGEEDDIVQYQFGERSAKMLKEMGLENVEFNTYSCVDPPISLGGAELTWSVVLVTRPIRSRSMIWRNSWRRPFRLRMTVQPLPDYELIGMML